MNMIPQLIRELYEGGEWAACRELSIAYLRQVNSNEILEILGGVYNEEKKFDKALECIEKLGHFGGKAHDPQMLVNKARCLYYLNRAPEAESLIRSLPYKLRESEAGKIDLGLYVNAQGKEREAAAIFAPLADTNFSAAFYYGWHLMAEDKLLDGYMYVRVGARDELRVWGHEWILRKDYNIGEQYLSLIHI